MPSARVLAVRAAQPKLNAAGLEEAHLAEYVERCRSNPDDVAGARLRGKEQIAVATASLVREEEDTVVPSSKMVCTAAVELISNYSGYAASTWRSMFVEEIRKENTRFFSDRLGRLYSKAGDAERALAADWFPDMFVCPVCEHTTSQAAQMKSHVARQHCGETHLCEAPNCDGQFADRSQFLDHVRKEHGQDASKAQNRGRNKRGAEALAEGEARSAPRRKKAGAPAEPVRPMVLEAPQEGYTTATGPMAQEEGHIHRSSYPGVDDDELALRLTAFNTQREGSGFEYAPAPQDDDGLANSTNPQPDSFESEDWGFDAEFAPATTAPPNADFIPDGLLRTDSGMQDGEQATTELEPVPQQQYTSSGMQLCDMERHITGMTPILESRHLDWEELMRFPPEHNFGQASATFDGGEASCF